MTSQPGGGEAEIIRLVVRRRIDVADADSDEQFGGETRVRGQAELGATLGPPVRVGHVRADRGDAADPKALADWAGSGLGAYGDGRQRGR
jgi:hypothetical protein